MERMPIRIDRHEGASLFLENGGVWKLPLAEKEIGPYFLIMAHHHSLSTSFSPALRRTISSSPAEGG